MPQTMANLREQMWSSNIILICSTLYYDEDNITINFYCKVFFLLCFFSSKHHLLPHPFPPHRQLWFNLTRNAQLVWYVIWHIYFKGKN